MQVIAYRENGDTSNIERVFLYKDSGATAGTEGDPITGLTNASTGLNISTIAHNEAAPNTDTSAATSSIETIATLGTYATPTSGFVRFKEVDATDTPGLYEIQWENARYAVSSGLWLDICISGVADLAPFHGRIYTNPIASNVTQLGADAQSLTDLKDFADAGYDPGTNKVQGVVLVDTTTANTDMVAAAPTAAAIVNEWETQSQADPTGFHVNVLEVGGTAQTANDNGADINTILSRIIGTLAAGTHNPATAAQIAVLSDWINGGRLDLLLDAIPTTAMRGTDSANTVVPDAAGTAPTAVEIRQEMDTNSVDLNALITAIGTAGAGLTDLGGMSTGMKAEVNAEMLDVLVTDTFAELAGVPAATASLADKIAWICMLVRNKGTQTSTTKTLLADDGSTTVATSTISDDTVTFIRNEYT